MPETNPILNRLVEANTGFVHALALRLAPAPGLADDIAQQVFLELFGRESTRIDVSAGTELKLASLKRGKRSNLLSGTIQASVARQRPLWPMIVTTPNAEARVLGTRFTLTATTNRTRLDVAEGRVRFTRTSDGAAVKVGVRHYAVVATSTELAALPQTGALLREIWTGIPGGDIRDLLEHPDYPAKPVHRDLLKTFESPTIETNNFGCRLAGYLHPPVTGDYTFWVVSGSDATLWLSPNDDPSRNVVVASAPGGLLRKWNAPLGLGSGDVARPHPLARYITVFQTFRCPADKGFGAALGERALKPTIYEAITSR